MRILVSCALVTAASFAVTTFAFDRPAEACGGYDFMPRLSADDALVAAKMLERDLRQRLTSERRPEPKRRLLSRAGPRRSEETHSVSVGLIAVPRKDDPFASVEQRTVTGELTLTLPDETRVATQYRVSLRASTVELLDGKDWVRVADWRRQKEE